MTNLTIRISLSAFFLVTCCLPISAQTITLSDAVGLAKSQNLKIEEQIATRNASMEASQAAGNYYLPTVSLYGGFTHLSEELTLDLSQVQESFVDGLSNQQVSTLNLVNQELTGMPLTDAEKTAIYDASSAVLNDLYPNFDARLAYQDYFMSSVFVNQPIFLGGKLNTTNQIAKSTHQIAEHTLQQTTDIVAMETITAYLTLLLMQDVLDTRSTTYEAMVRHDSSTVRLVEQEIIPAFYEYGARAAMSSAESQVILAQNLYDQALTNFKTLLNVPIDTVLEPSGELAYMDVTFNATEAQETSVLYSPLLKINKEAQYIANSNIDMAQSGFLPDVFAVGEYQLYQANLPVITPPWMVGVHLKWDIFSGGRHVNNVQSARLLKTASEKNEAYLDQKLRTEVLNATSRIESLKSVYLNQIDTKKFAKKNYEAIQKQYKHGLVRSNEVIDARVLYEEAELAEHEALYFYYLAALELYSMTGSLNTFIEQYEAKF